MTLLDLSPAESREMDRLAAVKERTAHRSDWFQTATGRLCFVMSPELSSIDIVDIAIALSRICRFGGHLRPEVPHYSVAQHSVFVSYLVPPELALRALLHDAAEAYLGDAIRPLKNVIGPIYKPLEHEWEREIGRRFHLGDALRHMHPAIKRADSIALETERRDLCAHNARWEHAVQPHPDRIVPLSAFDARELFMLRFSDLYDARLPAKAYVP